MIEQRAQPKNATNSYKLRARRDFAMIFALKIINR